ncbi:MAG: hypothetical protein IPM76_18375 [Chloroflexi bacterium]|nr:hypothetical protein [Chloroflexota bacterium]
MPKFIETTESGIAITGESTGSKGIGVKGEGAGVGVRGDGKSWHGVAGLSESTTGGAGVYGKNTGVGTGVMGESDTWMGVYGKTNSTKGGAGVMGEGALGGVIGKSTKWNGVYGETEGIENGPAGVWGEHKGAGVGVKAKSKDGAGLVANSQTNVAIHAETQSPANAAIAAYNLNPAGLGAAIYAEKKGAVGHAGFFVGDVHITKTLVVDGDVVLSNADCAEEFDVVNDEPVEPGMVMVLGANGILEPCQAAYDKRVAGVISGAGTYKPGIVLDKRPSSTNRQPIALMGKVYCMVDADYGAISAGDLLTSSDTIGHAMRADDPFHAFGAVIGKALQSLTSGRGLIPVLVSNR